MFKTARAIQSFVAEATTWQASTLALASSAAVCFLIAGKDKKPLLEVAEELQKAVTETGLGRSQVYTYISRGRKLAAKLVEDNPARDNIAQGVIYEVFDAKSPAIAAVAILGALDAAKVTSADRLDVYLGGQPRALARAARQGSSEPRPVSAERIVQTFEAAKPKEADEIFAELIAAAPKGTLTRWAELISEELSTRGRGRHAVRHAGQDGHSIHQ